MPVGDVNAVVDLKDKSQFGDVADQLFNVVDSSVLGEKMFGWASKHVLGERVEKIVKDETKRLGTREAISQGDFRTALQECVQKLEAVKGVADLPEKRCIKIVYRGWSLETVVSSLTQQAETHFMIALRGWAVEAGLLDALPGESTLCTSSSDIKIEDKLLLQARSCRAFCARVLKSESCVSGDEAEVCVFFFFSCLLCRMHSKKRYFHF